jgi:hypothetical protein
LIPYLVAQVPLNACFAAVKVSLGPEVAARRASNSGLGSGVGGGLGGDGEKVASGDGDEPGSGALLWCLCVLHNSLARDLRLHTDNPGARSPAMHQR